MEAQSFPWCGRYGWVKRNGACVPCGRLGDVRFTKDGQML